jgi:RHS repeat-associated protein
MKKLLTLILTLVTAAVWAQNDSAPGRIQSVDTNLTFASGSGIQSLFTPAFTPLTQSGAAIAEAITPDIQALAGNLGNDPTRIFNFVHDQIRYVPYFGSLKGAELTLLERSGNDFDQCALLSALLQAAGYSPQYQFGYMIIPYDNPTNHQDFHHWWGLSLQNTNWTSTRNLLGHILGSRGYSAPETDLGDSNRTTLQRIWVTLSYGGTNYYLDPSFKVSEPVAGINLASAMGFNSNTLMTAAGGTDTGYSVSGLNEASLRSTLQTWNSSLLGYLSSNLPNATVAQIIGGQQIVPSIGLPLSNALAFSLYTNGSSYPAPVNWTSIPTNFMSTFSVSFSGSNQTWLTPQLQGGRVSLTFDTNGVAQLWLEDSSVMQVTNTGSGGTVSVILSETHPYGGWNSGSNIPVDTGKNDFSSTNTYQRTNASYAIIYSFEASPQWLQARQQKLDAYRAQGWPDSSRQVTTETLNVMGLGWMVQTEMSLELFSQQMGLLPHHNHRFGRMGLEAGRGYYVDVYLQQDATVAATGYGTQDVANQYLAFDVSSYVFSAMEHGIIEQLQSSNLVAASTVKMLQIANTNSQTVYLATSSDWTTGPNVRGSLVNYSSGSLTTLDGLISQGFFLLLPQNGSNHVAGGGTWGGNGYVELGAIGGNRVMGMIIGGGYNGGYVSDPTSTPSPSAIATIDVNQFNYIDPQSATLPVGNQLGADPVNLVDGSFQIAATDLALGQTEPRGLNLTRYYSSARRNVNLAGMAPGWLHSYYCNAQSNSAPELGLGGGTVQQMVPMIVTTYAALNLYNNVSLDPKNWTVTALVAKWGIDQLTGNSVSVNLGNQTVQFVKQPDGSYTPPGNSTMSLIHTNTGYWLQERHGRTFKFGANGALTNISDQYGQGLTLGYNSSNQVQTVTDWKNRSLTFTYTGGILTSVADSTGRSVSYGYTGGDLTSFVDAQGATNTFLYDTGHQVVATFDASNRLVVTNFFDGFGHINTQLTQGDTNKTWQVYASGYDTVQIDPAGGRTAITYDGKSRPVTTQDALGNVTQTFYDGQDHVIQTVSPLLETNQFIYDGNHNLIESIDPLGYSNVFVFDSQNRLITSTDARGNPSHFGYNAQFSLTGQTNGAGDYVNYVFNGDGTLYTRSDSVGTTTYGYDSYGQLSTVTYPSSLGTNHFINTALGDVATNTNPRGFATVFQYNQRRQLTNTTAPTNLTTSVGYDLVGNVQSAKDARGNSVVNTWSPTRHLLTTTFPTTPQGVPMVTNIYDSRDWLAKTLDPLSQPTSYSNDLAGRLIAVADPLFRTNIFSYDNDGQRTNSVNAALESAKQQWSARGELLKSTDAAMNVVKRAFDPAGNQILLTNRNGKLWQFQFDAANRLTNTISPLTNISQTWNNRGLLQSVTDPKSQTTSFGYDALGRLNSRTDPIATTSFILDANGNLATNSESGQSLIRTFDAYDRVSSYTDAAGYVIQYRYDANHNLTSLIYPGGRTVNYFYDNLNRLTNVTDWQNRQTSFTYDLASRLQSVTRPNLTTRTLNYDAAGELTNIIEQAASRAPIAFIKLNYNNAARVQWEFSGPLPQPYTPPSRTMTFGDDNRLATVNGTSVTNDANGNLTYGPLPNGTFATHLFDARNRLLSAGGLTYGYDLANNRVAVTNGTNVVRFVINPNAALPQVLMRIKPGGITNYYVYGAGLLYEVSETSTSTNTAYYHFDSRGSTVALTDANGNVTDHVEYSAYGMTTFRIGTNDTPFLYNGRYGVQTDPNGLLFMRARYYNPYICRFLNPDPSGFAGGLNFYAYADGNPVSEIDPFGLGASTDGEFTSWITGFGGAVGSTITGLFNAAIHPLDTAGGVFNAATHPVNTAEAVWNGVGNTLSDVVNDDPRVAGRATGNIAFTIATAVATAGGSAAAETTVAEETGSTVLSGHGALVVGDFSPITVVPRGTSLTFWTEHGNAISDALGNAIETGKQITVEQFPEAKGACSYLPGSVVPDYTLYPPTGLNILGNPTTVLSPTRLGNLLRPGMGNVNWAACRTVITQ